MALGLRQQLRRVLGAARLPAALLVVDRDDGVALEIAPLASARPPAYAPPAPAGPRLGLEATGASTVGFEIRAVVGAAVVVAPSLGTAPRSCFRRSCPPCDALRPIMSASRRRRGGRGRAWISGLGARGELSPAIRGDRHPRRPYLERLLLLPLAAHPRDRRARHREACDETPAAADELTSVSEGRRGLRRRRGSVERRCGRWDGLRCGSLLAPRPMIASNALSSRHAGQIRARPLRKSCLQARLRGQAVISGGAATSSARSVQAMLLAIALSHVFDIVSHYCR